MEERISLWLSHATAWPVTRRPEGEAWRGSWGAPPVPPSDAKTDLPTEWAIPSLEGRTVVQRLRLSAGGERVRLRLTNEYGDRPLTIGRASVALEGLSPDSTSSPLHRVTFSGAQHVTLGPGEPRLSDPVHLPAPALARLRVSLFLPGPAARCSAHPDGGDRVEVSKPGDFTDRGFAPAATTTARPFLSAVDVQGAGSGPVIVTIGDSITDGHLSSCGQDRRWPDRLAERLSVDRRMRNGAVVNVGISGNRLLGPDPMPLFGEGALARLDRDALAVAGVTHLVVLEGVNDLCAAPLPGADAMIAAYRQIILRAQARRVRVILGTILPFEGSSYFRPSGEAVRLAVNQWIRAQAEAHGVIDFDAVMRDPQAPGRMLPGLHAGDWMHPNDAGYRAMGDAPPLDLFC